MLVGSGGYCEDVPAAPESKVEGVQPSADNCCWLLFQGRVCGRVLPELVPANGFVMPLSPVDQHPMDREVELPVHTQAQNKAKAGQRCRTG